MNTYEEVRKMFNTEGEQEKVLVLISHIFSRIDYAHELVMDLSDLLSSKGIRTEDFLEAISEEYNPYAKAFRDLLTLADDTLNEGLHNTAQEELYVNGF